MGLRKEGAEMNKWSDIFILALHPIGVQYETKRKINGWLETANISEHICFIKSVTYNVSGNFYFLGVDPGKLQESGDLVIICGGIKDSLRDIFIIPWQEFFSTISMGEAINTYKLPRVYYQYKFKIYNVGIDWRMDVQGGTKPSKTISKWHYEPKSAADFFK
jgi:hypothetical protein